MKRSVFLILLITLLALMLSGTISQAQDGDSSSPIPLYLKSYTFTTDAPPQLPSNLSIDRFPPGSNNYYIVQFQGPIQAQWRKQLRGHGIEILEYIPDFAYKVRMNPRQLAAVKRMPGIHWVGIYQPAYKISPQLSRSKHNLLIVRTEKGIAAANLLSAIRSTGASVLSYGGNVLRVAATGSQIDAIANIPDIAWIEPFRMYEKHNEYGGGEIMGGATAAANGYDGATQIVAIADTGLGHGSPEGAHPDIPDQRIVNIFDWPSTSASNCWEAYPDGSQDVDSGHGTHTAVSAVGDGGANGEGKGMAFAAKLVMQTVEDYLDMIGVCATQFPDGYYLMGLPDDLHDLFTQAYDAGARIHSDSWGSSANGEYTTDAANTDDFMWTHRDMLITFSAGNDGVDADADGVVDADSIGSPATAKNVLTVGASENKREDGYPCDTELNYGSCADNGGRNTIFTYGQAWPNDFPAEPLFSDSLAGNAEQMAAFSSRGPTDDGRIKPDVVAPGTYVLSGYSDMYQQSYDAAPNPQNNEWQYDGWGYPYSDTYKYMGGTSMSNPLTAGAAALVRDFYQKAYAHHASAALTKATLINSAVDMQDENNDGMNDNAFPIPNIHEGWGRVNVAAATDGSAFFVDEGDGLNTGDQVRYAATTDGSQPLKITLVWTDVAASPAANKVLVNDLDLTAIAPTGQVYHGNVFSGGWSAPGGAPDHLNNVENVYIQNPEAGDWTIHIESYNVPVGEQPYALVVDGAQTFGSTPPDSNTMHVNDLEGASQWSARKTRWGAQVTISVVDANGAAVAQATVTGAWNNARGSSGACLTDESGLCTISSPPVPIWKDATTFSVTHIEHNYLQYAPQANSDADGDSDGTSIVISRPPLP